MPERCWMYTSRLWLANRRSSDPQHRRSPACIMPGRWMPQHIRWSWVFLQQQTLRRPADRNKLRLPACWTTGKSFRLYRLWKRLHKAQVQQKSYRNQSVRSKTVWRNRRCRIRSCSRCFPFHHPDFPWRLPVPEHLELTVPARCRAVQHPDRWRSGTGHLCRQHPECLRAFSALLLLLLSYRSVSDANVSCSECVHWCFPCPLRVLR